MADISKINVNNTNYDIKDAVARGLIWQGTQAQYDAITTKNPNAVYFITDGVTVACSADEVLYDNITSGLSATDVQSAIDELSSEKADSSSLATVATSGSYNDLSNKPTIPAAQVNSDWSAVSGISEILNKPTTLSGYGITDAKIVSGTITLGSNSITPLTQHQSVTDNNPSLAWGTKSKVATIGSTEINVTMPANPNTTYTFVGGTDGFTVTPSGGTAQTVTVTPDLTSKMDKTNPTGTGTLTMTGDVKINGNVSVGDAITLDTSGTATRRITDITVLRSKIVKFNGINFFNAAIRADADVAGNTTILDVSTGFEPSAQQSLLVTSSTGGTIQAYIQDYGVTITRASSLTSGTVYYIIGWYT